MRKVGEAFRVRPSFRFELQLPRSSPVFMLLAAFSVAMLPSAAIAQSTADPVSTARLRLGPFGITPSIDLASGLDTNVFNDTVDPKEDWTTTVNPKVDVWFRIGPVRFEVRNNSNFSSFNEYTDQGGLGTRNEARLDLPLNRTSWFVAQTFVNTRERPTVEVDSRVRRRDDIVTVGTNIRASSKTTFRLNATRALQRFDDEASFGGVNLATALNRRSETGALSLRYQVATLTTLVMQAEAAREAFDSSPLRDSESVRVSPGIEFDPHALIGGRAFVGYRRFIITSGFAPRFTGVVASVELTSTIRGATRLSVQANRDVAYSYDIANAYYLLSGVGASVTHRLAQNWDVTAEVGFQDLNYERWTFPTTIPRFVSALPPRFETVELYRGGIGYRFGESMRLSLTGDHSRRTSTRVLRPYEGTRILSAFSYGS